ncbi:MAG: hypothetical protein J5902_03105 [Paludibacteraceae bacterium]|nr:hypothetical protein [Paludibacteraceae bacterium]MBQ9297069.1 hypothetical protein [Paludibacteraceae bacterium]
MKKIKQFIFDYILRHQPDREVRFPHMELPLKVMIIYESDVLERNDAIKAIRQDLLRRQMDVTMWGYVEKKEISTLILPQSRILGTDSYNILGKLQKDVLTDLQAETYDLLIDLTTRPCLPLRYIAMYTRSSFKVGLNLGEGVHDMLISPPNLDTEQAKPEATWLYDLIITYLTQIKSCD